MDPHAPAALPEALDELDLAEPHAGLEFPARARKRLPEVLLEALEQKHLRRPASPPRQLQPSGKYASVVDDHKGFWRNERRQVRERRVLDRPSSTIENEQAGLVATVERTLSDQLGGQLVVKLGRLHADIR
jgi:hypothetical protein